MGALELALRQLREKLAREGLFDPARKRPLPPFVRRIAVVTSPTGAAIHDFLQVLGRRWRGADVLVVPVRVQGEGAAAEIAAAIETVNRLTPARSIAWSSPAAAAAWKTSGRSTRKPVVRAIAASRIPVVSAVGHEIDVTLSDLAADVRALTPSEAAELVAPAAEELVADLRQFERRLAAALRSAGGVGPLAAGRACPARGLSPPLPTDLRAWPGGWTNWDARAARADSAAWLRCARQQIDTAAGRLESLSPLAVLGRGYSLTQRTADGRVIRDAAELSPGEEITTRFARGQATSRVERIEP